MIKRMGLILAAMMCLFVLAGASFASVISGKLLYGYDNSAMDGCSFKIGGVSITAGYAGEFSAEIANGTYDVTSVDPGYTIEPSTVTISGNTTQNFTMSVVSTSMMGRVYGPDGNPARNFPFKIAGLAMESDSYGNYFRYIANGVYEITVDDPNFEISPNLVTVSGNITQDFNLSVRPSSVSGTLIGSDGNPVNGSFTFKIGDTVVDSYNGSFYVNVPNGTYEVTTDYDHIVIEPSTVTVSGVSQQDFRLKDRSTLTGKVIGTDGNPAANFTFNIGDQSVTTDADGNYSAEFLFIGTRDVTVPIFGVEIAPNRVTLSGHGTKDFTLTALTPPDSGHKVVFNAFRGSSDKPAKGVAVKFNGEWKLTDVEGKAVFSLEGLGDFDTTLVPWKTYSVKSVTDVTYDAEPIEANDDGTYTVNVGGPETLIDIDMVGNVLEGYAYDENSAALANFTFRVGNTEVTTDGQGFFRAAVEPGTHKVFALCYVAEPGSVTVEGNTEQDIVFGPVNGHRVIFTAFRGSADKPAKGVAVKFNGEWKLTDADGEAVFFLEGLGDFDINIIPWKTYSVASVTEYGAELTADANGVYVINVSGPETFIGIDIAGNVLEGCAYDENDEVLGNFTFSVGDTEVTTDENGYFKTPIEAGTHEVTAEGSVAEPGEVTVEGVTSQDFRFRVDGDEPEMFNFSGTISNVARAGKVPFSGEYDPETGEYVYEPVLAATNFETGEVFYITPTDVIGATGRHGASGSATCSSLMFDCLLPAGKYKVQFFNGESYDSAYIYRIAKGDTVVTIGDGPVTANYRIQSIRNSIR